jgi:hypothetical protein
MAKKKKVKKVPVTMRALIQRINRKLTTERGYVIKKTRGNRWRGELGDYYAVDPKRNCVVSEYIEPEDLGRELGVLRDWEKVRSLRR